MCVFTKVITYCFLSCCFYIEQIRATFYRDPDAYRDTVQLIESRGFKAETHYVTTEDGYILTVHRIINPYNRNKTKKVMIMQHGLTGATINFIFNSPGGDVQPNDTGDICDLSDSTHVGKNIGFELSKFGFDVWLTTTRGSGLSVNHSKLSTKSRKYWKFSFDQMIESDLPASIDYIQEQTGAETVAYVGHSEGALCGIGLLASFPEYNNILKPFIPMGPPYGLRNLKGAVAIFKHVSYWVTQAVPFLDGPIFKSLKTKTLAKYICATPATAYMCTLAVFSGTGFDDEQLNKSRIHVYLAAPTQTSRRNMLHYGQMVMNGKEHVYKMDFGYLRNILKYGKGEPPKYDVGNITNKYIALMYSENDLMAPMTSIEAFKRHLKVPLFEDYLVPFKKFNHIDYVAAKDVDIYINRKMVEILKRALC